MNRFLYRIAAGVCMILSAVSCTAIPRQERMPLQAEVICTGQRCLPAPGTWRISLLSSSENLVKAMKHIEGGRLGVAPVKVPDVDFDQSLVLWVEMGERPSGGYGFDRNRIQAFREKDRVLVQVGVTEPASGSATAQEITSPCVLIRIPKSAAGQQIVVQDTKGTLLARIP